MIKQVSYAGQHETGYTNRNFLGAILTLSLTITVNSLNQEAKDRVSIHLRSQMACYQAVHSLSLFETYFSAYTACIYVCIQLQMVLKLNHPPMAP